MKDYWKVGELAALTGLTIRTLRYYDQIELFSPSQHTQSGHRLYTKSDLSKLQEILALKHIGISLDEIKTIITNREDDFSVSIIEAQISRIKKDLDIQQNLLHKLESAFITIRNKKVMSVEELTKLLEAMKMYQEKYFTKEQLDRMKSHYDAFDQDTLKEKEQEFKTILEKIQIAKNNGVPPNDSKVQALAKTWSNIVYSFSKQDQDLQKQMESFHAQNPENSLRFGMDSEIYKYIKEALK